METTLPELYIERKSLDYKLSLLIISRIHNPKWSHEDVIWVLPFVC